MEPTVDTSSMTELLIITKYNEYFMYLYPMVVNLSNRHRVLRDHMVSEMVSQYTQLHLAVKTNQLSKYYLADTGLATLREYMRILSSPNLKLMSLKQYGLASAKLTEVGKLLGSRIKDLKR